MQLQRDRHRHPLRHALAVVRPLLVHD
jgi:hypothetical protein